MSIRSRLIVSATVAFLSFCGALSIFIKFAHSRFSSENSGWLVATIVLSFLALGAFVVAAHGPRLHYWHKAWASRLAVVCLTALTLVATGYQWSGVKASYPIEEVFPLWQTLVGLVLGFLLSFKVHEWAGLGCAVLFLGFSLLENPFAVSSGDPMVILDLNISMGTAFAVLLATAAKLARRSP